MNDTPPLVLQDVGLTLPSAAGPVEILRNLNLTLADGERVALVGPSGSGKSSLIAVAAGLERPSAGTVQLFGQDMGRLDEDGRAKLRRGRVSLVFQSFHLLPNMTAEENVAAPMEIARRPGAMAEARAWLDRVGLIERADEPAGSLPYGAQRRLEIARAMCTDPRILCLDEPAAGLNPRESDELSALLMSIRDDGCAVLLIEHDMGVVMRISAHVIVLDHGVGLADGTPTEIKANKHVIAAYLGEEDPEDIAEIVA